MEKNLYDILGLTEEDKHLSEKDFQSKVKTKFKELAKKYHPDVNKEPDAEQKFKEVAFAHEILSDPQKRQNYDLTGSTSNTNFGDIDLNDIMNNFFRGESFFDHFTRGFNNKRDLKFKGNDINLKIKIDFQDSSNGSERMFRYKRNIPCSHCDGGEIKTCPYCGGKGMIVQTVNRGFVFSQSSHPCPHCNGAGQMIKNNCKHCNGSGIEQAEEIIKVNIPKGTTIGDVIRFEGKGDSLPKTLNGKNGNLNVIISEINCGDYIANGYDLFLNKEISIFDIITGCDITIKTPTNHKIKVTIPKNTKNNEKFRVPGYGLPTRNFSSNKNGDIYVVVVYKFPTKLSKIDIQNLETLKNTCIFDK